MSNRALLHNLLDEAIAHASRAQYQEARKKLHGIARALVVPHDTEFGKEIEFSISVCNGMTIEELVALLLGIRGTIHHTEQALSAENRARSERMAEFGPTIHAVEFLVRSYDPFLKIIAPDLAPQSDIVEGTHAA